MAELLALPAVATPTPGAMLSGLLDMATPAADPFAALLADAQAGPVTAMVQAPSAAPLLSTAANEGQLLPAIDLDKPVADAGDAAKDDDSSPSIDPAISPALAMLTALILPDVRTPPVVVPMSARAATLTITTARAQSQLPPPAAGEQDGASASTELQGKSPIQLVGGVGNGASDPNVLTALLAEASPSLIKQVARDAPNAAELAAVGEPASADTPPIQPKARPQVPPVAKDIAPVAIVGPRLTDNAEEVPAPVRHVAKGDVPRADPVVTSVPVTVADIAHTDTAAPVPATDQLVQRQLVIADDGRWLDSLARDIAQSASGDTIRFKLEPVNLGSLTVAIAQGSDGAAIRLTAETHRARDLLVDAQPALVAEARANGLRISETHVDLGNNRPGNGDAPSGGQQSFTSTSTGQQAMRQDARRQPDLPPQTPTQIRSPAARTSVRDSGERFA